MVVANLERHQLNGFRQQLGVRATDLRRRIAAAHGGSVAALADEVHDAKDQAAAEAADEVSRADLQHDKAELADVELALARLDVGTYGICCDCGRPVGQRRLKAYPTAKRCRDCQQAQERRVARAARG